MSRIEFGGLANIEASSDGIRIGGRVFTGPIRVGDRFTSIRREGNRLTNPVDLVVKDIDFYGNRVDELEEAYTAWLVVVGDGASLLAEGDTLVGSEHE